MTEHDHRVIRTLGIGKRITSHLNLKRSLADDPQMQVEWVTAHRRFEPLDRDRSYDHVPVRDIPKP